MSSSRASWPVHGSVLVEDGVASFVCGRSCFLDGGMKFFRLDAKTGKKLVEAAYTDRDPESGKPLDELHKTLQMPTALSDILSSDGKGTIYLRSQKIDHEGKRVDIAPVSGNAIEQGPSRRASIPTSSPPSLPRRRMVPPCPLDLRREFLRRSQRLLPAREYTPTGRILVFDDENVYSYGREAKYLKWTTTMEHTLQASSKVAPDVKIDPTAAEGKKAGVKPPGVTFPDADSLNPADKALTVECWILPDGKDGVLLNHGAGLMGYALSLKEGKPVFHVRDAASKTLTEVVAPEALSEGWHHLAAVLGTDLAMTLYVDGDPVGKGTAKGFPGRPKTTLSFGGGGDQWVGPDKPTAYRGMLDQVVIHHRPLDGQEVLERFARPEVLPSSEAALLCTFDRGDARDESATAPTGSAPRSKAARDAPGRPSGSVRALPLSSRARKGRARGKQRPKARARPKRSRRPCQGQLCRAQVGDLRAHRDAGHGPRREKPFVAGPPDVLDEEYAFERLSQKDPAIQDQLAEQDAALEGQRGAVLWRMNIESGEPEGKLELDSPPVWDGMVVARGNLYVVTVDGRVKRFGK